MPPKGWKKWTLYQYKGARKMSHALATEAMKHLRWMGHKERKIVKNADGTHSVYHGRK